MKDKDNKITSYEYDNLYRLTKASYPEGSITTYTYDPVGNRLTMNDTTYTYNQADQLLTLHSSLLTHHYSYDNNGNMTSKTEDGITTNYSYDYANRLTEIRTPNSEIRNSYDGYGRRVSRLVKNKGFGIPEPQITEYLWDGTNVLCEFYQNKHNPLEFIYGNDQLISRDDLLWLKQADKIVVQASHWFHQDGLGSVVNLTDGAGDMKLSYDYDAFGEITEQEGGVGWKKNQYTFTGKPYDPAAGMYYFGARWYDTEMGRFITEDPFQSNVFKPVNIHKYAYCRNNPVTYIDRDGRAFWIPIIVGTALVLVPLYLFYEVMEPYIKASQELNEKINTATSPDDAINLLEQRQTMLEEAIKKAEIGIKIIDITGYAEPIPGAGKVLFASYQAWREWMIREQGVKDPPMDLWEEWKKQNEPYYKKYLKR